MRRRVVLASVGLVMLCATAARADDALGAQIGAGYLPMSAWEDFWEDAAAGNYQQDRLGLYAEFSFTSRFTQRHALRFAFEWITTSASAGALEWDFETFPVSASYELTLRGAEPGALTLLGVGAGYYMSSVEAQNHGTPNPTLETRNGDGYGFHGYLRQTALIADHVSLSGMIRGRWADGMAFDDSDGDINVEFTGIDLSMGIEYRI